MSLREAFQDPVVSRMASYRSADELLRRLDIPDDQSIESQSVQFIFRQMYGFEAECKHTLSKFRSVTDSAFDLLSTKLDLLRKYEAEFFESSSYERDAMVLAFLADDHLHGANASIRNKNGDIVGHREDFPKELAGRAAEILEDAKEFEMSHSFSWLVTKEVAFMAQMSVLMDTQDIVAHLDEYENEDLHSYSEHAFRSLATYIGDDTSIGKTIVENIVTIRNELDRRRPTAKILSFPTRSPQL